MDTYPWLPLLTRRDADALIVLAQATLEGRSLTWEQVVELWPQRVRHGNEPTAVDQAYTLAWRSDGAREWLIRPVDGRRPKWRKDVAGNPGQRWEVCSQEVLAAYQDGSLERMKPARHGTKSKVRRFPRQQPVILSTAQQTYVKTGTRPAA